MIKLIKPEFIAGSEKRFFDFIGKLNDEKTVIISHTDLDGVASAKVVNKVVDADSVIFADYSDLNEEFAIKLKEEGFSKIIITDLNIDNIEFLKKLEFFSDILLIDHHNFIKDFNSNKTVFLNAKGFCAAYLSYYLFSKIEDIEKLDWLIACASISDWQYFENFEWMKKVFSKYGDTFEIKDDRIRKNGLFWDLQLKLSLAIIYWREANNLLKVFDSIGAEFADIGGLNLHAEEVQKEIDLSLKKFEKEKKEFNGRFFWEFEGKYPLSSIVCTILSEKYLDKTLIVGREKKEYFNFSARRQDGGERVDILLKKLVEGLEGAEAGGHTSAAGGFVLMKDKENFIKLLKVL